MCQTEEGEKEWIDDLRMFSSLFASRESITINRSPFETFSAILESSVYMQYFTKAEQTGSFCPADDLYSRVSATDGGIAIKMLGVEEYYTDPQAAFDRIKELIDE